MYLYDEKLITPQEKDLIIRKEIFESQIETDWDNKTITFEGNTIKYENYNDRKRKIEDLCTQERLDSITKEEVDKKRIEQMIELTKWEFEEIVIIKKTVNRIANLT